MSKHTPEPWTLFEVGGAIKHLRPTTEKTKTSILTVATEDGVQFGAVYRDDDARRIVACVNACAGFTTEDLEDSRPLEVRLTDAFARICALIGERNQTGMAIDAAIRDGIVPDEHPLRSRLEMLANHRLREQDLAAQLKDATRQCGVMADSLRYLREFVTTNVWDDEERSQLLESIDSATASTKSE